MFIEIKKIPEGSSTQEGVVTLSDTLAQLSSISPEVPVSLQLRRMGSLIVVDFSYTASLEAECARCLTPFTRTVRGRASFTVGAPQDEEMSSDEVDFYYYGDEDEAIDFSQSLYDDIMTRVPQKLLCDSNCPGFKMPSDNKDEQKTEEPPKSIDPRWQALKKLKN